MYIFFLTGYGWIIQLLSIISKCILSLLCIFRTGNLQTTFLLFQLLPSEGTKRRQHKETKHCRRKRCVPSHVPPVGFLPLSCPSKHHTRTCLPPLREEVLPALESNCLFPHLQTSGQNKCQQTFDFKSCQTVNIWHFACCTVSVATLQLGHCCMTPTTDNT